MVQKGRLAKPTFLIAMKTKDTNITGFSIVEIVVATAVIGMMIIAMTNLLITVSSIQEQNDHLALASRQAEAKIESLRNSHYNSLPLSPPAIDFSADLPAELPEPKSATVTVTEPSPGLKRLDVSITYHEVNRDKTVSLSALLGNIGLAQ